MSDTVYRKLAAILDTLPNGFPSTEDGVELRLLEKIFRPEDAEFFGQLRLVFETPGQIAQRAGRPLEEVEAHLKEMWRRGQIFGVAFKGLKLYKMVPWAFGIYELQLPHMDRELAELSEAYMPVFGRQFLSGGPPLMQVVPIEREIPAEQQALTYERVSSIIEKGQAFLLNECICKKEQGLLGHPCAKPLEVCLAIAPVPGVFDGSKIGRVLTREEAYGVLEKAEEAGLVHLTWNIEDGHFFICNCCGCCCGILRGINELGIPAGLVVNSHYFASIDPDACVACGICKDERCQVGAIEEVEGGYRVLKERCIGCGLCVGTCPTGAVQLVRKPPEEVIPPPKDERAWFEERGRRRGVDFSAYR